MTSFIKLEKVETLEYAWTSYSMLGDLNVI